MITLEIKNEISQEKMKMVVNILKELGISAVFITEKDDTKLTKQDFIDKIERSRKSLKIRVSAADQAKMLEL